MELSVGEPNEGQITGRRNADLRAGVLDRDNFLSSDHVQIPIHFTDDDARALLSAPVVRGTAWKKAMGVLVFLHEAILFPIFFSLRALMCAHFIVPCHAIAFDFSRAHSLDSSGIFAHVCCFLIDSCSAGAAPCTWLATNPNPARCPEETQFQYQRLRQS